MIKVNTMMKKKKIPTLVSPLSAMRFLKKGRENQELQQITKNK
jgi:hypothetical protein